MLQQKLQWIADNFLVIDTIAILVIIPAGFLLDFSLRYRDLEKNKIAMWFLGLHEMLDLGSGMLFDMFHYTRRRVVRNFVGGVLLYGLLIVLFALLTTIGELSGVLLGLAPYLLTPLVLGIALAILFLVMSGVTWLVSGVMLTLGKDTERTVFAYFSTAIGFIIASLATLIKLLPG